MSDPSLELQGAIVARLRADAAVSAIVADRVYDRVPATRITNGLVTPGTFPYISFGPEQIIAEDAECITGSEVILQLDCWSRAVGRVEVKRLADAVRRSLDEAELPITTNALVLFEFDGSRVFTDPDGLTSHAVLTFRSIVEQR